MHHEYFSLCLVLSIGLAISSAERDNIVIARSATNTAPKPTTAPLLTSTPRPPLDGAKPTPAPTKAPAKAAVVIINAPPKRTSVVAKPETPAKEDMSAENVTEKLAQQMPTIPLQVTGFITDNGNIYEVTDKDGVGMIESRQSPDSDVKSTHVCNYGSVVIYSDVPCDQVTNVRIGEVQQQVVNAGGQSQQPASTNQPPAGGNNNAPNVTSNKVDDNEFPDFDDGLPQKQKRKRVNKNPNKQRKRNGLRNRPNAVRQAVKGKRRGQQAQRLQPQQQRRRQQINHNKGQQQQRRRLQQQKQKKRRRNQNGNRNGQRRKYQGGESFNRRRYNANAIYDEERRL